MVEGNKTIKEIPRTNFVIKEIFSVDPDELQIDSQMITRITSSELKKISFLQNPKDSVAVCELKEDKVVEKTGIQLILDGIQDPGNLGTIIRLADWFGLEQIICSQDTVDVYNPKVVQASMGSFLRVRVSYRDITSYLSASKINIGTDMEGENLYEFEFPETFNLIMGNEGNGIRGENKKLLNKKITIPQYGKSHSVESLNVAMSAGIILGQIFAQK